MKNLEAFEGAWGDQYPSITKSWRGNWHRVSPFFAFAKPIRKAIYTTNAIEALNRQLRKALKPKGHFRSEPPVYKVVVLGPEERGEEVDHATSAVGPGTTTDGHPI